MSFMPAARAGFLEGLPVIGQVSLSGFQTTVIADGQDDGNLIGVDLSTAIQIAYDALSGDTSALANIVNQEAQAAEENLPEGAQVVLQMTGWQVPLVGSVGQRVADQVNAAWQSGQAPLVPWPGNSQVAYYDAGSDTVSIYWVKGQTLILYAVIFVLVALGILTVVGYIDGLARNWGLIHATPVSSGPTPTTPGSWWSNLPLYDKLGIVIVGGALATFGLWFLAERSIAAAGAPKSNINIVEPGATLRAG